MASILEYAGIKVPAGEMLKEALIYCQAKTGRKDALELIRKGEPTATGYFRYRLAQEIGSLLGQADNTITQVYLYPEEALEENAPPTVPLTLVVCTERRTAALDAVVESLDGDLLAEYRKMVEPAADGVTSFSNICLVEQEELYQRKGLSAIIGSLSTPSFCVWRRH
ncbi:MAG: hypothetical protein AB1576_00730 [Bacillota bacterium]|jgi:hypothetical protein